MKKAKKQNKAVDWIEKDIIITDEFLKAFESIEKTSDHIFLTGRAGTGKSTLLKYFRSQTKKKYVVLAPTGVAALNVKGQTIHSFFGFHPKINKHRVRKVHQDKVDFFKKIETIVIDEVSMVRTDLLDCVDRALRLNRERPKEKFGGVQMIFVGDLFQLPPVVTKEDKVRLESEYSSPYFFSSDVIKDFQIHIIELEIVYRQKEKDFLELLNNIRSGKVLSFDKEKWNQRHDPFFELMDDPAYVVHLTTTNKMAKERNDFELKKLSGKELVLKAEISGELGDRKMPSEAIIKVKVGARIIQQALTAPLRQIAANAGVRDISLILNEIKDINDAALGYDFNTMQKVDMLKAGIVDPMKVTRTALENAASIATTLITMEVVIADLPEKKEEHGHGMPGMGGGMDMM